MPALTIESRDEAERLGLEQALAFFTRMRRVARTAPTARPWPPASKSPFGTAAPCSATARAPELRVAVTAGPVDRRRPDRGSHQATRESAVEADGGALEGGTRRPFGGVVRVGERPRVERLLE